MPQCGYCQAGQIMTAAALLVDHTASERRADHDGDDRQHLPMRNLHQDPRCHSPSGVHPDGAVHIDGAGRRRRVGGAMTKNLLTRRSFLQVSAAAGGGMIVALQIDPVELFAQGPPGARRGSLDAVAFVKIAPTAR